jgi:hypothetical protein
MQNPMSSKQRGRTFHLPLLHHGKKKRKKKRDRGCCLLEEIFDASCFVATAAYESPTAEPVRTLRRYRDQRLARTLPGRIFIRVYYRYGPYGAIFLRRFPQLKPAVRYALRPIVAYARKRTR